MEHCLNEGPGEIEIGSEDAAYPQQDKKTPWSFTVAWHWVRAMICVG